MTSPPTHPPSPPPKTHSPKPTSITLHPARPHDIPVLASLASAAFSTDRQTILKTLVGGYDHAEGMKGALEHWIGIASANDVSGGNSKGKTKVQPRCEVLKAVEGEDEGGEVLGWVCWGFRGFETSAPAPATSTASNPSPAPAPASESKPASEPAKESASASEPAPKPAPEPERTLDDPIARLEALTNADMDDFCAATMPKGTKCLYIMSIVVSPLHQSRGVGTALIQYGTRRADEEGVFAWVHSSEAGAGMFERQGFREVRRLRVALDEFCGGRGVDGVEGLERRGKEETGWGDYVFRYMVRQPSEKRAHT